MILGVLLIFIGWLVLCPCPWPWPWYLSSDALRLVSEPPELGREIERPEVPEPRIMSISVLIFKPEADMGVGVAAETKDRKFWWWFVSSGLSMLLAGKEGGGDGAIVFEAKTGSVIRALDGGVVSSCFAEGGM